MVADLAGMNPYLKAGTAAANDQVPSYQRVFDLALNNALTALDNSQAMAAVPSGVIYTTYQTPCAVSGTVSTTWDDANNNHAQDAGDTFSLKYNQCTFTGGTTTYISNGSYSFTLTAQTGDPTVPNTSWNVGMSFAMNLTTTYSMSDGTSGSSNLSGGASLAAAYDQVTTVGSGSMMGSSLKLSHSWVTTSGSNSGSDELADFNFATTDKASDNSYTVDIDYTLRSTYIGGSVTVKTDPLFSGVGINPPTSGTMVITGANNSKVTLVANSDGATVTMTVNSDAPQTVTWSTLGGW